MDTMPLIIFAVVMLTTLGMLAVAFLGPSPAKAMNRRLATVRDRHAMTTEAVVQAQMRKRIGTSADASKLTMMLPKREQLAIRLKRTGKGWTLTQFTMGCMGMFLGVVTLLIIMGAPFLLSALIGVFASIGLPFMFTGMLINKRVKKFNERFADGIDLMVRGLKSGLPVTETFQIVSQEIPAPVGEEFRGIVERIRIGKSMEAALQDTADMLGTPEFQFFCITLSIQRETGGNLAETLNNLSEVLRKRTQMKLKVKAMSSEAKASAYIVGSLPFFVFGLVWMMNPDYLRGFFYEERLIMTGIGGLVWMGMGVAIMAKMIRFEI